MSFVSAGVVFLPLTVPVTASVVPQGEGREAKVKAAVSAFVEEVDVGIGQ
jgi:hypothetical protein